MLMKLVKAAVWYATGLQAGRMAVDVASGVAPSILPVLAGPIDIAARVFDPFDWSEYRARKERSFPGKGCNVAGIVAEARKEADAADSASREFRTRGKELPAIHATRWAELSREVSTMAMAREKEPQGEILANVALTTARLGQHPPMSALQVLPGEKTDDGRAIMVSAIDAVNRMTAPWDAKQTAKRLADPRHYIMAGRKLIEENAPVVGGSCCSSCVYGEGSCSGHDAVPVPEDLIDGSAHGSDDSDDDGGDNSLALLADSATEDTDDADMLDTSDDEDGEDFGPLNLY